MTTDNQTYWAGYAPLGEDADRSTHAKVVRVPGTDMRSTRLFYARRAEQESRKGYPSRMVWGSDPD